MIRTIGIAFLALILQAQVSNAQYKQTVENKTRLESNVNNIIPLKSLDQYKIAVVTPNSTKYNAFIEQLQRYSEIQTLDFQQYDEKTKYYNTIIVAGTASELHPAQLAMLVQSAVNNKNVILCQFGSEYDFTNLSVTPQQLRKFTSLLRIADTGAQAQEYAAMSIFGGLGITQDTLKTEQTRLQYVDGVRSDMDLQKMGKRIDAIAKEAIDQHAAPAIVVMAVKDGQVIFEKAYGSHTYDKKQATQLNDIFDLASVSKIAGTTPVVMHLQEKGIINLDSTMGHYLWQAKQTNKANITLRTVLLHEAGFTPFIPFYKELKPGDLLRTKDAEHQVQVADNAFLKNNYYQDVMWPEMLNSPVKPIGNYVYSDISMYVMKEVSEHETSVPMQDYVQQILYKRIGMKTAGYLPRNRFDINKIVPTQNDTVFRKSLLQGFVHDEGAAMAGGVAGHAGLFSSANDLAIYGQMLLNRGSYGGVQYFKPETIDLFTSKQSASSRRGLGFDRYDPKPGADYPSKLANESVYGHTGYTGTCIWIDPRNQFVYIFLSNRVHPQVSPKLSELNIRSRIQDVIYQTINNAK
ncbi:serine hydrolase [Sphingobacterium sp. DK4209]|uniref:Serine hydrolase n=1 Tax=Sphingobacterium zhuxiongii TaxID=2662364 RepID=A0A5Q0Q878_9SPHI|nr:MULTISPECIES: serine hydrolase domain-containing protein [unclassified Sphingobacterium]MVZ67304.1 serine hydrolase [Sphingobacterium sp. DK4209]QGA25041.1 serine hydrolase [Sphingobacterium sp. dk4302]